jgi:serine-type D-Ala-D-Ala carboxypeptidase (penicillin-binding protein 5/6)
MRPLAGAATAVALLLAPALLSVSTAEGDATPGARHPTVNRTTGATQPVPTRADLTRPSNPTASTLRGTARAAAQLTTRTRGPAVVRRRTRYHPVGNVVAPPVMRARAWVVADLESGAVLGRHRARVRLPQASTIKVLTALTALRRVPSDVPVRATARAASTTCSCAGVVAGRRYPRWMLLAGMLTTSGNDAAEALAGGDRRGRGAFIAAMNRLAARLGTTDTVAKNPSGLDTPGAHSSARDLIVLLRAATQEPRIARWLDARGVKFGALHGNRHWLSTSTDFVHQHPQSYAAKNGYTSNADNTLVTATRLRGHRIAVAVLGAPAGRTTTGAWALTRWGTQHAQALAPVGRLPAVARTARGGY